MASSGSWVHQQYGRSLFFSKYPTSRRGCHPADGYQDPEKGSSTACLWAAGQSPAEAHALCSRQTADVGSRRMNREKVDTLQQFFDAGRGFSLVARFQAKAYVIGYALGAETGKVLKNPNQPDLAPLGRARGETPCRNQPCRPHGNRCRCPASRHRDFIRSVVDLPQPDGPTHGRSPFAPGIIFRADVSTTARPP